MRKRRNQIGKRSGREETNKEGEGTDKKLTKGEEDETSTRKEKSI